MQKLLYGILANLHTWVPGYFLNLGSEEGTGVDIIGISENLSGGCPLEARTGSGRYCYGPGIPSESL